jgi:hypothetical protein
MSLTRVQQISVSLDGFATGEGPSLDTPFGHAGERLHEWMFVTRWWGERAGQPGGSGGVDDAFLQLFTPGIGAESGANASFDLSLAQPPRVSERDHPRTLLGFPAKWRARPTMR